MHLIIANREDPHLPLARLRARGQLTELRATDLRFTASEASELLNQVMGLDLSATDVAALETRTEGWIAGLQLAAISLQGHKDATRLIKSFSGSHRFVLDYLVEEVLDQQTKNVQTFLLKTAVLNRLTGSLCDALTDQDNGQATLEALEHANLFIMPLDEERRWYRYHHLFAELLRARLRLARPNTVATLHTRASEWFEQHGSAAEAVNHALAAKDYERAARLVEQNTVLLLPQGELHALLRWIKALPEEVARRRPWVCIYQAWALAIAGQLDSVESLLQDVARLLNSADSQRETAVGEADQLDIEGHIATMRAYIAVIRGDASNAIKSANLAGEMLPENSLWARSVSQWALGMAHIMRGELAAADQSFTEFVSLGRAVDNLWLTVTGLTDLALVYHEQGSLQRAAAQYREALEMAAQRDSQNLGYMGRVEAGLAQVLYEQNDLDGAHRYATASIEKTRGWKNPNHFLFAYNVLARVLQARGDYQGALDAVQKADQVGREGPVMSVLIGMNEKNKVRLWLAQDKLEVASQWVHERGLDAVDADGEPTHVHEVEYIALARIRLAQRRLDEAYRLLRHLLEKAEVAGYMSRTIEILNLQALAFQARGETARAMTALERALTLAEPGGFVRIFVDEGPPMSRLLYDSLTRGVAPAYAGRLLAAFPVSEPEQPGLSISRDSKSELIEPLSEREVEVLQLVAEGLTNREIASRLFVSLNTVKAHTRNLYGKLNVHSRTQAIVRSQELGILPGTHTRV
jgi:LuxR family maltose regulon positive regulatory protein